MRFHNFIVSSLIGLAGLCSQEYAMAGDVHRDSVALSVSKSDVKVNGRPYESGSTMSLSHRLRFPVKSWVSLESRGYGSYSSYGLKKKNGSEELRKVNLSLEARTNVSRFFVGVGADYLLDDELMLYQDTRGFFKRRSIGPCIRLGFEHKNIDISAYVSDLFGYKRSSLDKRRLIKTRHLLLSATPRFRFLEAGLAYEIINSEVADFPKDTPNYLFRFTAQVGADVNPHLSFFPAFVYERATGMDDYSNKEIGIGAKIRW